MGILTMIKNALIAGAVFVAGLFAAVMVGKSRQKTRDVQKAAKTATDELQRIQKATTHVQTQVDNAPDAGPGSVSDQLRSDFTAPD